MEDKKYRLGRSVKDFKGIGGKGYFAGKRKNYNGTGFDYWEGSVDGTLFDSYWNAFKMQLECIFIKFRFYKIY